MERTTRHFTIGAGLLAALVLGAFLHVVHRQQAIETANQQIEERHFAPRSIPANTQPTTETVRWVSLPERKPVPNGYRCINGQLFRVRPNEVDQVTDGSASTYCR